MDLSGFQCGGGGGIRTHGTVSGTAVFKTAALNHSATPPEPAPKREALAANFGYENFSCFAPAMSAIRFSGHLTSSKSGQKIHVQRDLDLEFAMLPKLLEREVEGKMDFLDQSIRGSTFCLGLNSWLNRCHRGRFWRRVENR